MEVSLVNFFKLMWKKIWILLLCLVLGFGATYGIAKISIKDTYTSTVNLFFNYLGFTDKPGYENSFLTYSKSLAENSVIVLDKNSFYIQLAETIKNEDGKEFSWRSLQQKISYKVDEDKPSLAIYVKSLSADDSYLIAKEIQKISSDYLKDVFGKDDAALVIKNTNMVEKATKSDSSNRMAYSVLGGIIVLIIAMACVFLKDKYDVRIKSEEDLKEEYDLPILGMIPKTVASKKGNDKKEQ